jgi:hypothetical protein
MEYLRETYALGDDTSTGERDKRRPPGSLCVQKPPVMYSPLGTLCIKLTENKAKPC